jgi:hypothetical protein
MEAGKRHRLSHAHVQMARELRLNPKKLGKLDNHRQEAWKAPLPVFIEHLYFKRFGKRRPNKVMTIRQLVAAKEARRQARKLRREERRNLASAAAELERSSFDLCEFEPERREVGQRKFRPEDELLNLANVSRPEISDLGEVFIDVEGDRDIPF